MYMRNLAEPQNAGDCSGWERDPQSFSKRVADHYLRTVLGLSLTARSIRPPQPGSVRWEVLYRNDIVIAVIFAKGFVATARIHPSGPIRHYNYTCTPKGDLVLSDRPLPSSVVSRRFGEPPPATAAPRSAPSGAPAPAAACTNALDATARAIIAEAQDPKLGIYGRAVRAVWSILANLLSDRSHESCRRCLFGKGAGACKQPAQGQGRRRRESLPSDEPSSKTRPTHSLRGASFRSGTSFGTSISIERE